MLCRMLCRSSDALRHLARRCAYASWASPLHVSTSFWASLSSWSSCVCSAWSALWMSALACCREPKLTRSNPSLAMGSPPFSSERQREVAAGVGDPAGSLGVGRVVSDPRLADRLGGLAEGPAECP